MVDFMNRVLNAQVKQAEAMIEKHKINVEVLTKNASGVAEHPDTMKTVEDELAQIAHWTDIKSAAINNFDFENKRTLTE
jgi:hypothetical protein|tara:strand:- start:6622 stop:6858 length:237 start_codon:yes stop_codon:yes gene_type:complete